MTFLSLVSWSRLLQLLGSRVRSEALPAVTRCPLCEAGLLKIFRHALLNSQWCYCFSCGFAGDILLLAETAWECNTTEVLSRLRGAGCDVPLAQQHQLAQLRQIRKQQQLTRKIVSNLTESGKIYNDRACRKIAARLKLPLDAQGVNAWRREGLTGLVGAELAHLLEQAFCPGGRDEKATWPVRTHVTNPFNGKIFSGTQWEAVVAFPFWTFPGYPTSLRCVGRQCHERKDYRELLLDIHVPRQKTDGGFFLHPSTFAAASSMPVLAMRDLLPAARMLIRGFDLDPEPLPIVVWSDDADYPTRDWSALADRDITFWSPHLDARILRTAALCNSRVSTFRCDEESLKRYSPVEFMHRVHGQTLDWSAMTERVLSRSDDNKAVGLLIELENLGQDIQHLLSDFTSEQRKRLRGLQKRLRGSRSVEAFDVRVYERGDCWYYRSHKGGNEVQISDAVLEAERLIQYPAQQESFYQGVIRHNGREVPFVTNRERLENNACDVIQEHLTAAGAGFAQVHPQWKKRLETLMTLFNKPRPFIGHDRVGWQEETGEFILPEYRIQSNRLGNNKSYVLADPWVPGRLPKPGSFDPVQLEELLERTPVVQALWHTYAAVLAQIVAHPLKLTPPNICGLGEISSQLLWLAAEACGVACRELLRGKLQPNLHRWPQALRITGNQPAQVLPDLAKVPDTSGRLVGPVPVEFACCMASQGWQVIDLPDEGIISPHWGSVLASMTSEVLQNWLAGRFEALSSEQDLVLSVLGGLRRFLEDRLGTRRAGFLTGSPHVLPGDQDRSAPARLLVRTVEELQRQGRLHIVSVDFGGTNRPEVLVGEKSTFLGRMTLVSALQKAACPGDLDADQVTRWLRDAGALRELNESPPGWLVSTSWWKQEFRQLQNVRTQLLRIAE